jgi:hypothetical protein
MMMASTGQHAIIIKVDEWHGTACGFLINLPKCCAGCAPFQDPAATKLRLELRRALELSGERAERLLQAEADAEACLRLVLALKQREAELEQDAASRAQL